MAVGAMHARERRRLRLFIRRDTYGRYVSVLVYLPRDRYNTNVRERFSADPAGGPGRRLGRVHRAADRVDDRPGALRGAPAEGRGPSTRSTPPTSSAGSPRPPARGATTSPPPCSASSARRPAPGWSGATSTRSRRPTRRTSRRGPRRPTSAGSRRSQVGEDGAGIDLSLYEDLDAGRGEARLKVYRVGPALSLSELLPMLSSMGVEVVDERPYQLDLERPTYIYEFGLRYGRALPDDSRELVEAAIRAIWDGRNEIDGFNALVLGAGLTWRQATVLRAYAKYMRQGNSPFALDYIEGALRQNVDITRLLALLFEVRFDPRADQSRAAAVEERIVPRARRRGEPRPRPDPALLPHPHPGHAAHQLLPAGTAAAGCGPTSRSRWSRRRSPTCPQPRPKYEIFVYSPRVEGVHLRFGAVARGGLRWSDRRDDFRTEVLGLVKAQMVKNTVIVPVGAKGGFFPKQLPDPASTATPGWPRASRRTRPSSRACSTSPTTWSTARPSRRADVVRHDGDDSYLVVAADKGTATFSDIANGVSEDYGFWLGDAFAQRRLGRLRPQGDGHHRARRVGLGAAALPRARHRLPDRGLHLRRHRRHVRRRVRQRHALLRAHQAGGGVRPPRHLPGPDPDPAASFAERQRLFALPRSSWQDYDHVADLRGRRHLLAVAEEDHAQRRGPRARSASTPASRR